MEQMRAILPAAELQAFAAAMGRAATVSIRRNVTKSSDFIGGFRPVAWCDKGVYLEGREAFTFDPLLHGGCYYVQDASSMILHHIAAAVSGGQAVRWLDLCAAPGGKSTAIIDALPAGSRVVANEIVAARAAVLAENMAKWGTPAVAVTSASPAEIGQKLGGAFDVVSTDVPCSGEGMMRKDAEAVAQWNPALVAQCAARQRSIIDDVWPALRPGGYFIYSTCTFNREENEKMVDFVVERYGAESLDLRLPAAWGLRAGIDTPHHCYRFMPHLIEGEGLFVAVLRKPGSGAPMAVRPERTAKRLEGYATLLREPMSIVERRGTVVGTPPDGFLATVAQAVRTLSEGVALGAVKGKSFVPDARLALSTALNREAFPTAEVDYATAVAYLRGEAIGLAEAPRGVVAVTYEGVALGFVKNVGNRANNLYPQPWRIRSSHLPPAPPCLVAPAR